MSIKHSHIVSAVLLCFIILHGACVKEYSYEGGNVNMATDTTYSDTTQNASQPAPWTCPDCIGRDIWEELRWSFYSDSLFACGTLTAARVNAERTAFTCFGPSACSPDTGMIISVYLNGTVLNRDLHNINSQNGAFYYYDNIGQTHILISNTSSPFSVTLTSYDYQTGMATGTFSGPVYRPDGRRTYITSGKYKIRIP